MNFEGKLVGTNLKVAIVVSRFNDFITNRLLDGAKDTLVRHGVDEDNIDVAYVPGAFEIPLVAKKLAVQHLIMTMFVMKLLKAYQKQMMLQIHQLFSVF